MDAIRRSQRISRRGEVRKDTIKDMMSIEETIMDDFWKRQLTWYGQIQRISEARLPTQIMNWQPSER